MCLEQRILFIYFIVSELNSVKLPQLQWEVEELKIEILNGDYKLSPRFRTEMNVSLDRTKYASVVYQNSIIWYTINDYIILLAMGLYIKRIILSDVLDPQDVLLNQIESIKSWCSKLLNPKSPIPIYQLESIFIIHLDSMGKISLKKLMNNVKTSLLDATLSRIINDFLFNEGVEYFKNGLLPFPHLSESLFNIYWKSIAKKIPSNEYARYIDYIYIPIYIDDEIKERNIQNFFNSLGDTIFKIESLRRNGGWIETNFGRLISTDNQFRPFII